MENELEEELETYESLAGDLLGAGLKDRAQLYIMAAGALATLELANQQRISNLIELQKMGCFNHRNRNNGLNPLFEEPDSLTLTDEAKRELAITGTHQATKESSRATDEFSQRTSRRSPRPDLGGEAQSLLEELSAGRSLRSFIEGGEG